MKYLCTTVETYRFDTENEAERFIAEAKTANQYELSKYTSEHKEKKSKGEVIDEYWKVSLTKLFNNINEPYEDVSISYSAEA